MDTLIRLEPLIGRWAGRGEGRYPTIEPFRYRETLRFAPAPSYPLVHYEQRTVLIPGDEPSHWESGFIRPVEGGTIEVVTPSGTGSKSLL